MRAFAKLKLRLRSLFRRKRVEDELDRELAFHIDAQIREYAAAGMDPDQARRAALRSVGNAGLIKEEARETWNVRIVHEVVQDVRYAVRSFARTPGFTLIAVLTLTLGIGANTTVFSVVDAVLLRPLPYADPDRLVSVWQAEPVARTVSGDVLERWNEEGQVFEQVGGHRTVSHALTGGAEPVFASGQAVTVGVLPMLGVMPQLGRFFAPEEQERGADRVVILSDRLWRRQFNADPDVIGRTILLTGEPHIVVGVMPPGFRFPREAQDYWLPLVPGTDGRPARGEGIARLRRGLDIAAAAGVIGPITERLNTEVPIAGDWGVSVEPLGSRRLNSGPRRAMFVILGAVGFVLLIATVNTTNLLLSRSTARRGEMAMRVALGAGAGRLVRQFVTESLLLAGFGAVGGVVLSIWGVEVLMRGAPTAVTFSNVHEIGVHARVLAFTAAIAVSTGLVCGLFPGMATWRSGLSPVIKEDSSRGFSSPNRLGFSLVGVEIVLSVVLLVGAGLLMRSFVRLTSVPLGFDDENVVVATMQLFGSEYAEPAVREAFFDELRHRVAAVPGVRTVTLAGSLPPGGSISFNVEVEPEGQAPQPVPGFIGSNRVAADFFEVLAIPLLRGRSFGREDVPGAPPAIVVSQTMADRLWPETNPVGRRVRFGPEEPWKRVVGVVADIGRRSLDAGDYVMDYYESAAQNEWRGQMVLIARADGDPEALVPHIREQVWAVDPNQPIINIRNAIDVVAESTAEPRFYLLLMSVFAASAMILAAVGVYGVMSYAVSQRTAEIGIRMSLGAASRDVVRLILGRAVAITLAGLGIGLAGALGLARLLEGLLFEVSPVDPQTYVIIGIILLGVATIAGLVPAIRATRIDPLTALRSE